MANKQDVITTPTTNVRMDNGKKDRMGKKHRNDKEEMLLNPTPCEALTFHPPSTTEFTYINRGFLPHNKG